MPPLEALSLGKRIALAIVVVVVALLILMGLSRIAAEAQPRQEATILYQGVPLDAHLLQLDKRALEDAYHNQILHLFTIWLKGQAKGTEEITNGLQIARRAYNLAARQIKKREQELEQQQPKGTPQ
jgi:hypothetical protein